MICPYCEAELENDSKFCTNCGKSLDTPEALEKIKEKQPAPTTPETTPVAEITPVEEEKKEEVSEPVIQKEEVVAEPVLTPINTPAPSATTPQDNDKKKKTIIIIACAAGGALLLFLIGIIVIMGLYISRVKEKIGQTSGYDPTIGDYSGIDFTTEGKVIKKVKDPMNHEIVIQEDNIYIVKVNTDYLYDEADAMREKAKLKKVEDVDKLNATDIQKQATKKAIDALSSYSYSKSELETYLQDEHYDAPTIKFAINNCGADWKEQTAIKIKDSLASGGSSKVSLLSLLVYEGFKEDDVKEALNKNDYDFYEQAASDACFYKYTYRNYGGAKTREEAETLLRTNDYTEDEIKFALKAIYDDLDY